MFTINCGKLKEKISVILPTKLSIVGSSRLRKAKITFRLIYDICFAILIDAAVVAFFLGLFGFSDIGVLISICVGIAAHIIMVRSKERMVCIDKELTHRYYSLHRGVHGIFR